MATYLLDSSVIIDALNGKRGRHLLLEELLRHGHLLACCSVNVAEVYAGMKPSEEAPTEEFLRSLDYYNVTWEIARRAGLLKRENRGGGPGVCISPSPLGRTVYAPLVDQAVQFLRDRPEIKTSALLNEKLGDLLKGRGRWLDAAEPYEQALSMNPTPQQRLKIALSLTTIQSNLGRGRQAYEIYQGLLRDYPNYPDRIKLYQKILPLADQFGKPEEAAAFQKALQELTPK